MMAIVSKAVFESEAGKSPSVGAKLGMDRYTSAGKALARLAEDGGGKLYLVTVRPPDEKLWLVAILEKPTFNGKAWIAKPSTIPITDISNLRGALKFESGKGITAAKGALGMSLQTPRALSDGDVALLDAALGDPDAPAPKPGRFDKTLPPAKSGVAPAGDRTAALLAAILDDPENLDARKIYADELAMHNDPRGEYILLQLALVGRLSIRKRGVLAARAKELEKKYAKQWWPFKGSLRRRAGFVEGIAGKFKIVNGAAPKLLAVEPASNVELELAKDEVDKLAKATWLGRVRSLTIRGSLGDEGFTELVGIPRLAALRSLNVTKIGVRGGLAALADKLPALDTLVLTANSLHADGIAALCEWQHLGNLERLYLSECGLGNDEVATLLAAKLPKLQKLTLSKNPAIGDAVGAIIAGHAKKLGELRVIELIETGVTDAAVDAIRAANLPNLRRIDVRQTNVENIYEAIDARVRY